MIKLLIFTLICFVLISCSNKSTNNTGLKISHEYKSIRRELKTKFEINYIPAQIEIDKNQNIFLSNQSENKVFLYNKDGDKIKEFGGKGEGPEELRELGTFCLNGDKLFINDWNGEIKVFSVKSGKNIKSIKYNKFGDFINVSDNGDIYLILGEFNKKKLVIEEFVGKLEFKNNKWIIKRITPLYENEFIKATVSGGKRKAVFIPYFKQLVYRVFNNNLYWGYPDHLKIFCMKGNNTVKNVIKKRDNRTRYTENMLKILVERHMGRSLSGRIRRMKIISPKFLPEFSTFFLSKEIGLLIVTLNKIKNKKSVEIYHFSIEGDFLGSFEIDKFHLSEISRNTSAALNGNYFGFINETDSGDIYVNLEKLSLIEN